MARLFDRERNNTFQLSERIHNLLEEKDLSAEITFYDTTVNIKLRYYGRDEQWHTRAQSTLQGDISPYIGDEFILSGDCFVAPSFRRQGLGSLLQDIKKEIVTECAYDVFVKDPRMLASVCKSNVAEQALLTKHGWKLITTTDVHGLWEYRFPKNLNRRLEYGLT